jgi:hypothetical protein
MKGPAPKIAPNTWKKLILLGQKQGSIKLKDLSLEMGLGEEETLVFLRQIFPVGIGAEIYQDKGECWVDINSEAIQYMLPLSPAEWIHLHHLLLNDHSLHPVSLSLKKKVTDNGPIKVMMELLDQLEAWDQQMSEQLQEIVNTLDNAASLKKLIRVITNDEKTYNVYPCKILHLEGSLSLISEDVSDHCLSVISLKDVKGVEELTTSGTPRVSVFEIEEFITAIRSMNEKETRLILKIHDPQSVNLFPDYQFLGKPCMVTNPNGDLIWAAYVEPCEALFDWLLSLGTNVEILDPVKFKQEYLCYCEEKMRKIA